MEQYFKSVESEVMHCYSVANRAKSKGFDPEDSVDITLAKNVFERVEGLVSTVASQIKGCGVSNRLIELEKQYGAQDWRVAFTIALEVAQQKFCRFESKKEAIEVGLRIALAYLTNGVVSSPLEGFSRLEIKKRADGREFFALFFSGPIRSAGTTATCAFVTLCDYVRRNMGYGVYDPTREEIERTVTEMYDYHERITNLQYLPTEEEIRHLLKALPMQIDGDPSEELEVSNYKRLARVATDRIRNGVCLVTGEALAQKAAKFWSKFSKWNKEFGMEDWSFMQGFIDLQNKIKARGKMQDSGAMIKPDFTYIKDLVAGRPVFSHPLTHGGFRLRYGRCRNSGFSSQAIHPATMIILNSFLAVGSQLKVERPGKATVLAVCDKIEGPIVRLNNGNVLFLNDEVEAKKITKEVDEIIYLGDILINYGDFLDRGHLLVPAGYNEEWYALELEKVAGNDDLVKKIMEDPHKRISASEAIKLCEKYSVPLHPRYTYHWKAINKQQLMILVDLLARSSVDEEKIVLPLTVDIKKDVEVGDPKRVLELLGVPHVIATKEYIVVEGDWALALKASLENLRTEKENVLEMLNPRLNIRDKCGTYIGARMGRPEKAKMRKLTGSPQVLFPVGNEGGRLRSFQSALESGSVTSQFPLMMCPNCNEETIYRLCEVCNVRAKQMFYCLECDKATENEKCHPRTVQYSKRKLDIQHYFNNALLKLKMTSYPELIKGVRGTSNESHVPEHLVKGILRAKYNLYVNKDGTIRYDMTETAITHFKPKEIGTDIAKLRELGYVCDVYGGSLENSEQILELKPQDIILPACPESLDESADEVLFRIANFIDDLLISLYGEKPFYNLKDKNNLVGHLALGLSPHTTAGIVCRIIGFSKTQGFYAHPYLHSMMRRDCFGYDTLIPIYDGSKWQNVKIGEFVEALNPDKSVDNFGTLAKKVNNLYTIGYDKGTNETKLVKIKEFTKHAKSKLYKVKTSDGREITVTGTHKFVVNEDGKILKLRLNELGVGNKLVVPFKNDLPEKDVQYIELDKLYVKDEKVVVRRVKDFVGKLISTATKTLKEMGIKKRSFDNYLRRDSIPLPALASLLLMSSKTLQDLPKESKIAVKRDTVCLNRRIPLNDEVLNLIGFYVAEGCARRNTSKKGFYQVNFAVVEKELKDRVKKTMSKYFNLTPSYENREGITYSSKLFYEFIVDILKCGKGAYKKRVPEVVLSSSKEKIASFLRGYFDGDGSVSLRSFRVCCDSVSKGLLSDIELLLSKFGIYTRRYTYTKKPGPKVRNFYIRKKRGIPEFTVTKLLIPSNFCKIFAQEIGFSLQRKRDVLSAGLETQKPRGTKIDCDRSYAYPEIVSIEEVSEADSYCLNVDGHVVLANNLMTGNCDGDEACIVLLMDALLNFSKRYLPAHRGAKQDEPLVLTFRLVPAELDDMVYNMDIAFKYPLEFYEATLQYKPASEVKILKVRDVLNTEKQYSGFGFTHDTTDINAGVLCSAYKSIPTMQEKVLGQMDLAEKIRAVDESDVARLIIERHFIRDIRGNLRRFFSQEFRCVKCNEKFRRPPLAGKCDCGGNIVFTVGEGSIVKYLEPSLSLARKYALPPYLKQSLELAKSMVESVFGRQEDKQEGLVKWFG